jgi:hypothetical protein
MTVRLVAKDEMKNPRQAMRLPEMHTIRHPYLFVSALTIGPEFK